MKINRSKFTPEIRARLLKAYISGISQRTLGERFHVDQSTIQRQVRLAYKEAYEHKNH